MNKPMHKKVELSIVLPCYNEAKNLPTVLTTMLMQEDRDGNLLDRDLYEVIIVDNNSIDDTDQVLSDFSAKHPELNLVRIAENEQGVACARKTGMDEAVRRSKSRDSKESITRPFLIFTADADCEVDKCWVSELVYKMKQTKAALGICNYYYNEAQFASRPNLYEIIKLTLDCRHLMFSIVGGFPDGKGMAIDRDKYEKISGMDIFYQLEGGKFINHLSDDWDFGIKMRAFGEDIVYEPKSKVEINPRRVDNIIDEVINGTAYGKDGIITMKDIRIKPELSLTVRDLTGEERAQAWQYSIRDFVPKNMILPLMMSPHLADQPQVIELYSQDLLDRLLSRIEEIKNEMGLKNFQHIHTYKTPSYRLYFEFADELFQILRERVSAEIGFPPPLPGCLDEIKKQTPDRLTEFYYYFAEDRESGHAHNYFGNGGVF